MRKFPVDLFNPLLSIISYILLSSPKPGHLDKFVAFSKMHALCDCNFRHTEYVTFEDITVKKLSSLQEMHQSCSLINRDLQN
jgi:hypothetical protein